MKNEADLQEDAALADSLNTALPPPRREKQKERLKRRNMKMKRSRLPPARR